MPIYQAAGVHGGTCERAFSLDGGESMQYWAQRARVRADEVAAVRPAVRQQPAARRTRARGAARLRARGVSDTQALFLRKIDVFEQVVKDDAPLHAHLGYPQQQQKAQPAPPPLPTAKP